MTGSARRYTSSGSGHCPDITRVNTLITRHMAAHLRFEPPRALDIRRVVCRVVWGPDEAPGARPQLGDGVPALASPVPGHVARQVQLRVGPQDDLGQRVTRIMIMLPKMRKCDACLFSVLLANIDPWRGLTPELLAGTRGSAPTVDSSGVGVDCGEGRSILLREWNSETLNVSS